MAELGSHGSTNNRPFSGTSALTKAAVAPLTGGRRLGGGRTPAPEHCPLVSGAGGAGQALQSGPSGATGLDTGAGHMGSSRGQRTALVKHSKQKRGPVRATDGSCAMLVRGVGLGALGAVDVAQPSQLPVCLLRVHSLEVT